MRHHFRILKIELLFHTIQNKSEKKYSCYDLTAIGTISIQLLERDFTNQVPPVYRLFLQSRRT